MQPDPDSKIEESSRGVQGDQQTDRRARQYIEALYVAARNDASLAALSDYGLSDRDQFRLVVELNRTYQHAITGLRPLQDVIAALHLYIETFTPQLPAQVTILTYDMLGSALCIQGDCTDGLRWLGRAKELCDGVADPDITLAANVEQHYGNALLNTDQVAAAVEALKRGVDLASRLGGAIYVEALVNLSVAYGESGDRNNQRKTLTSAATVAQLAGLDAYYAVCQLQLQDIPRIK
jgi:hypothetical protein